MNRLRIVRGLAVLLALTALPGQQVRSVQLPSQQSPQDSSAPDPVEVLLALANEYALNRFDNTSALALYSEALAFEATNSEILWCISRSYVDIAEHLPATTDEEKEQQLALYEKALEFADKSVAANPFSSMALTRRAIARSRVALFSGLWGWAGLMKDARADLEQALKLDPANHLALSALGATHLNVIEKPWILRWPLGLGWGDREKGIELLEKAVDRKWDFIPYRLACGRAYMDADDPERARAHLTIISLLPTQDEDDDRHRREARSLLEKLESDE